MDMSVVLDVRTLSIAVGAGCFVVAATLAIVFTGRSHREGAFLWSLGWAIHGCAWTLIGLRGIVWDFASIVIAATCFSISYCVVYAAVMAHRGRPCSRTLLFLPPVVAFAFFGYFSVVADNIVYRALFGGALVVFQDGLVAWTLIRYASVLDRRSSWLTAFGFALFGLVVLSRYGEGYLLLHGYQVLPLHLPFQKARLMAGFVVVLLTNVGFLLMTWEKAETRLQESEEQYRLAIESSNDGVAIVQNDRHALVNRQYLDMFGYHGIEEVSHEPADVVVHPDDRDRFREYVRKGLRGELMPSRCELKGVRKDGQTLFVEASTSVISRLGEPGVLVYFRDVTDRMRAEEEANMLKHSIDVYYDGAYWMDGNNRFVYVNAAACKALGYDREELMGKTVFDIDPRATAESINGTWERLRSGGPFVTESVQRRKDGTEFPVEIATTYVRFGGRELACGFARDITEKKTLEAQLRQAQKMEAIGTLAGGIAHDFNNILTVIMGLGDLIRMSLGPDDPNRAYIDQIMLSSERAADLTQSLLAYSRKQRIVLEPHYVSGVVTSTASLLKRLLPEDIELKLELADDNAVALLDASQINQVFMNLATNARDAMPGGGSLFIRTEKATLGETFRKMYKFGRPGAYARLSVSDTGAGMDEKTMARIFDPFFTTKEVGKGTGLGLASVYGIVKQHHGYITVTSGLLQGTTFDIYLPLAHMEGGDTTAAGVEARGGTETILVLEDDPDVRNMITTTLSAQGYTTLEASNGDDAIRSFGDHKNEIDLVVLDVVMPGKNGKEVFDEIVRLDPRVKAIFMSGYTGEVVIDRGVHEDAVDFLQKPLMVAKLLTTVREVLDR